MCRTVNLILAFLLAPYKRNNNECDLHKQDKLLRKPARPQGHARACLAGLLLREYSHNAFTP